MSAWSLIYEGYEPRQEGLRETLCALGNGYFVTRGAAPDASADDVHYPGTYLAGGYNRLKTHIEGVDVENEDLVNLPNWLPLSLRIDGGDWLRPEAVEHLDYRQELDLRRGVLLRHLRIRDAEGRITRWTERRFVSMEDKHTAGLAVEVTAENWSGRLTVRSALDGGVINSGVARYRDLASRHLETMQTEHSEEDIILVRSRFVQARLEVAVAARTRLYVAGEEIRGQEMDSRTEWGTGRRTECLADGAAQDIEIDVASGGAVAIEKIVALFTSADKAASEAGLEAVEQLTRAPRFSRLLGGHSRAWERLWGECATSTSARRTRSRPR